MRMNDMNRWLECRGFEVESKYDRDSKAYRFKITKDDYNMVEYFTYPEHTDSDHVDAAQRNFLNEFAYKFDIEHAKYHKYTEYCKADAESLYPKTMWPKINPCYGKALYIKLPQIENVIFNGPATIVKWSDGTKTVVKAQDGEIVDYEKGLAMAISKRALGNEGNYYNTFAKWLPNYQSM